MITTSTTVTGKVNSTKKPSARKAAAIKVPAPVRKKYGYFLGCVMPAKMPWAEKATFLVARHLGLDFDYMKETLCCIRPGVWKAMDPDWWLTMTSQNLAAAERQGITMVDSCNGCWVSHYETLEEIKSDPEKLKMVNEGLLKVGDKVSTCVEVRHFLQVLYEDVGLDKIKENVVRPLNLRVMRHVGCHARKLGEDVLPRYFDEILEALGVQIVDTPYDRTCCGLLLYFADPDTAIFQRVATKMMIAQQEGVDAYAIICSGCYDQFERAVKVLKDEQGITFDVPIVHLSELIALAFGYKPEDFGMERMRPISVSRLIEKLKEKEGGK